MFPENKDFWREEKICTQIFDKGFYIKTFRGNRKEQIVTLLGLKLMAHSHFPLLKRTFHLTSLGEHNR